MQKTTPPARSRSQLIQQIAELEADSAQYRHEIEVLRETIDTYRVLLDESSDPIFSFYPDGTYRYVNQSFADGVARKLDEIIGHKIWDVFPQEEADKRYAVVRWVFEHGETRVIEVRVPRKDGDRFYITTVKPIFGEPGSVLSVICISKDITERKRMEEHLRHLSMYDVLTGLYNRNFFETELLRFESSCLSPVSVVVTDLNHLKRVNDSLGHSAGDELIRRTARLLKEIFRPGDVIARVGGDEFIVLLPETGNQDVEEMVSRLRMRVAEQQDEHFSLSIGSYTGENGCSLHHLIRKADDRMYQDKASQKDRLTSPEGR